MAQFSGRTVSAGDAGMLVSGVAVLVVSFLPWYGWSDGSTYNQHFTAWDNVFPLIAVVLAAVAAALAATRMFDGVRLSAIGPIGPSFLLVLLPAVAVVLIVIGWLTVGEATDPLLRSVLKGEPRYGLFVGLAAALVQLVFAALAFQASGEGFSGRGRQLPPPPVPYGQPYGPQPTPGYWPQAPYTQAPYSQVQPPLGQPRSTYAYPQPAYHSPGAPQASQPNSPYASPSPAHPQQAAYPAQAPQQSTPYPQPQARFPQQAPYPAQPQPQPQAAPFAPLDGSSPYAPPFAAPAPMPPAGSIPGAAPHFGSPQNVGAAPAANLGAAAAEPAGVPGVPLSADEVADSAPEETVRLPADASRQALPDASGGSEQPTGGAAAGAAAAASQADVSRDEQRSSPDRL